MCGRYTLREVKKVFEAMGLPLPNELWPRYNIAPTQRVPVVIAQGPVDEMTWGVAPKWAGDTSKALINARSESVRDKQSFKAAFQQRRCLVLADGLRAALIPHPRLVPTCR